MDVALAKMKGDGDLARVSKSAGLLLEVDLHFVVFFSDLLQDLRYALPSLRSRDGRLGRLIKGYRIYFEDNGIGFDERNIGCIFVPFERLHGRGKYEGMGIGLRDLRKTNV